MTDPVKPSPSMLVELDAEQLRFRAAELEQARGDRHRGAVEAWHRVPETYRGRELELLPRCSPLLRHKLGKASLPTLSALLLGPSGIGKTTGLAWLIRRALSEFESSDGQRAKEAPGLLWSTAAAIALSDRRHPLGSDKPPLLAQATTASLLVIDDIGLEPAGVVAEVLWARYDAKRPVMATSGLTKRQLTDHLGAAGVRRLTDQHAGSPVLVVDAHEKSESKAAGGGKG